MAVRKIKKSYRSVTGYFMSRKNNRQIAFESTLEHDFYLFLEFDPSVLSYEEQPLKLKYECDASNRFYTPDTLVHNNGQSTLYEVKYQTELDSDQELQKKLSCIADHVVQEGKYDFKLFTDISVSPIYLQNLKFLYKFAFLRNTGSYDNRFMGVYDSLTNNISIADFLHRIDDRDSNQGMAIPYFWHFISLHPEIIDLNQRLSMKSLILKGTAWQN